MGDPQQLPDYVQTVVVKDSKGMDKILLLPKALDLDRPKRTRTAFAKWQLDALERAFELNPYLVGEQRTALAKRLALSETQIKVWYQNRRTKQRREGPSRPVENPAVYGHIHHGHPHHFHSHYYGEVRTTEPLPFHHHHIRQLHHQQEHQQQHQQEHQQPENNVPSIR